MDFMHDEGNLDLLTKIITHPEIIRLIQKFILSLDLDELAIIDPHEELSSSSIDNIQEINDSENNLESADVMVEYLDPHFMPNKRTKNT